MECFLECDFGPGTVADKLRATASASFRYCEGLRMPAPWWWRGAHGAGVRKPPREETAGGVAR